jgi:hypothetical protein
MTAAPVVPTRSRIERRTHHYGTARRSDDAMPHEDPGAQRRSRLWDGHHSPRRSAFSRPPNRRDLRSMCANIRTCEKDRRRPVDRGLRGGARGRCSCTRARRRRGARHGIASKSAVKAWKSQPCCFCRAVPHHRGCDSITIRIGAFFWKTAKAVFFLRRGMTASRHRSLCCAEGDYF